MLGRGLETPNNRFQLPMIRVDRPEARQELRRRIGSLQSGYLVLLGSPGSGKSTLLNTLYDDGSETDNDWIIYNCFTGTSDNFLRTRARADNFTKFLARELREHYLAPGMTFTTSPGEIESLLSRVSRALKRGRKLTVVIDGLITPGRFTSDDSEGVV